MTAEDALKLLETMLDKADIVFELKDEVLVSHITDWTDKVRVIIKCSDQPQESITDGQNFYGRFAIELKKQPDAGGHVPYYGTPAILSAARIAAGIDQ